MSVGGFNDKLPDLLKALAAVGCTVADPTSGKIPRISYHHTFRVSADRVMQVSLISHHTVDRT